MAKLEGFTSARRACSMARISAGLSWVQMFQVKATRSRQ